MKKHEEKNAGAAPKGTSLSTKPGKTSRSVQRYMGVSQRPTLSNLPPSPETPARADDAGIDPFCWRSMTNCSAAPVIHRKAVSAAIAPDATAVVANADQSSGQPLPNGLRTQLEVGKMLTVHATLKNHAPATKTITVANKKDQSFRLSLKPLRERVTRRSPKRRTAKRKPLTRPKSTTKPKTPPKPFDPNVPAGME